MKLLLNDKVTTYLKISMLFISILNWEYLKGENTSVVQVVPVSPTAASLGQFGRDCQSACKRKPPVQAVFAC